MTLSIDEIDFTQLSTTDRLLLAQAILDSVVVETEPNPLSPEDRAEMDRRLRAVERGDEPCVQWADLRAQFLAGS